jgi:hypothetical protein
VGTSANRAMHGRLKTASFAYIAKPFDFESVLFLVDSVGAR